MIVCCVHAPCICPSGFRAKRREIKRHEREKKRAHLHFDLKTMQYARVDCLTYRPVQIDQTALKQQPTIEFSQRIEGELNICHLFFSEPKTVARSPDEIGNKQHGNQSVSRQKASLDARRDIKKT